LAAQGCSTEVSDEDGAASNNASTNNNSANNADNIPEIVAECGDGVCHAPEVGQCAQDCGAGVAVCGNGFCGDSESAQSCPQDCGLPDANSAPNNTTSPNSESPNSESPNSHSGNSHNNSGPTPSCGYPTPAATIALGSVMPKLYWEGIYQGDGTQLDFGMEQFHCDPAFDQYKTALFLVTTGWCPACPDYIRHVHTLAGQLESAGMLIVFVEAENQDSTPSTHEDAHDHISHLIDGTTGLRVGDGQTKPNARQIYNSPIIQSFPSAFVVRRSDMKVIADQNSAQFLLPLPEIALSPDQDWSNPDGQGGGNTFNCGAEDEEPYEPNDTPDDAPSIEPGSFDGGVCGPAPDYYKINVEGPWTVTLEFIHDIGDLDLYIWDFEANAPDEETGSASITDDEMIQGQGPATIMVYGYQFASTTYTLTLTEE
jgi:hypothetical protein